MRAERGMSRIVDLKEPLVKSGPTDCRSKWAVQGIDRRGNSQLLRRFATPKHCVLAARCRP